MNHNRINSIDAFRGLAILGMVLANYLAGVEWVPSFFKHAPDVGFTVIDLVAPMFIFAIGLTYGSSYRHRVRVDGAWNTVLHFITRFFAILGIGALLSAGEIALGVDGQTINWGVLQAIGIAGLVTLLFIRVPAWERLLIGLALLAIYQVLLDSLWLQTVLSSPHGGLQGSLSWSGMLIIASVFGDLFMRNKTRLRWLTLFSLFLVSAALALTFWLPISKNRVSLPYVLLTSGLSGLLFCGIHLLSKRFRVRMRLLEVWGRNPLLLYVLHMLLLGVMVLPNIPTWYQQAPVWLVSLQVGFLLAVLTTVAVIMDKKKKYISL